MSHATTPAGLAGRLCSPAGVGLVVAVLVALAAGPWPVGVFYDDGLYLVLAKALATGEGYRYINLPGEPAAVRYPPGWPALLAVLWRAVPSFPENVALFKLANACLMGIAAAGVVRFARERLDLPAVAAAAIAVASAVTIPVLTVATVLFSEPLFLALLLPTLLLADRAAESGRPRDAVAAGAACAALALVRTVGVAAPAAAVLVLLLRRRPRQAALLLAVAVALLLPWQLWSAAHAAEVPAALAGSYGTYGAFLAPAYRDGGAPFVLDVLARNLGQLPGLFAALFAPARHPLVRGITLLACAALLALGGARLVRRAPSAAAFAAIDLGVVLLWPFSPHRFFWGIWTRVAAVLGAGVTIALQGAATLPARWRERAPRARAALAGRAALALGAAVVVAGFVRYEARGLSRRWWEGAQRAGAEQAMPLVRWAGGVRPDVVLASDFDPMLYLYTGRRTVPGSTWSATDYLAPASPAERRAGIDALLARYEPHFVLAARPGSAAGESVRLLLADAPASVALVQRLSDGGAAVFTTTIR